MKHGATGLLVGALALVGLATTSGRALAQRYEAPPTYHDFYRNGPQFVVDHWTSKNSLQGLGTNPGLGWRWYNAMSNNFHGYASVNAFMHNVPGANFFGKLYGEAEISLLISPRGLEKGWAPYFGGGGSLAGGGSSSNAGSFLVLVGIMKPKQHHTPFFEFQWFTRGSRISATVGLLL
jgi:hypothetical protein